MTLIEAKTELINRVVWKDDDSDSLSGRYLDDVHMVMDKNILTDVLVYDDGQFETKLTSLKNDAILEVLQDVFFDKDEVTEVASSTSRFDKVIIQKIVIKFLTAVQTSPNRNLTTKLTAEIVQRWYVELNGYSNTNNGLKSVGLDKEYKNEIEKLRKSLFGHVDRLTVVTMRG